tara:strand:- start:923 stop:1189 length:267 start_codon:yes stop_codon:yes gene_type:complete
MEQFVAEGFYVFDETNQGPIDFVAVNLKGDVQFIECKAIARRKDGSKIHRILTDKQRKLNKELCLRGYPSIEIVYSNYINKKEVDKPS